MESTNPYSTPQNTGPNPVAPPTQVYVYRSLFGFTRLLTVLLALGAVAAILSAGSSFLQLDLLTRMRDGLPFTMEEAHQNDNREGLIAIGALLLYLVTAVVFGVWIVRAHKNLRALGIPNLTYTPGWAFGWFFIPILNFFRPYQAMKELWQASFGGIMWQK